ncbi:hypothetical protein CKO44_20440 [Rubrivivax gelatinosus]|uniref:FecR domain-containing protein n=1 Tax=Rubrivivax gelatinosus TaxID=28068 RepID=UPI0019089D28|nr:FecR domain-containing protein [Rubrivivax gelatinosus]MBK1615826.1 hypothetical protein [Rubrivivax gelatinosus]
MKHGQTLDARVLDEAADWLVRLHGVGASDADRAACERWRRQSPQHARAWARAEQLQALLGGLPPALAMPALDRKAPAARRAALAKLALLLGTAPAVWAGWRWNDGPHGLNLGADLRTAAGERHEQRLTDGSRLTLNTGSAVDLRFDDEQRLLRLRAGEILVQSQPDPSPRARPLRVHTEHGRLQALGTRFAVRRFDEHTQVAVFDGAVRITPASAPDSPGRVLQAGEQTGFSAAAVAPPTPVDEAFAAWTQGLLLADRMRLVDLAAELQRYRGGFVHCDPAVAGLRVSGSYPVGSRAETRRTLVMLVTTYPVQALERWHGRWLTFVPR